MKANPYSIEAIEFLKEFRTDQSTYRLSDGQEVQLSFAGTTAKLVDEQQVNQSDIQKIVLLETLLILLLLLVLTRSIKMSIYMMATILISFVSALGLGIFLVDVLFGYDAISTRAPVYAFIFLVALGIDYNIILVSRFLEERKTLHVKAALEVAIRNTGGVISSAGIICRDVCRINDHAHYRLIYLWIYCRYWDYHRYILSSRNVAAVAHIIL